MGSEAGPLLATAPPCGKGPATHRHAAGPVSESLQATGKAALEPLGRAQLTADTSRRGCSCSVQTMLGQGGCDKLSPACLAFLLLLLLLLGAGVMAQDICNSPGDGDLPAPELFMSLSAAEEGEQVLFRCQLFVKSPDTRIVFCKDGVQVKSLKAQQKTGTYYMLFFMTRSNAGIYTCGYQHKNSSQVRNSALSAPQNLSVTGSRSSSQAETSTEASVPSKANPHCLQNSSKDIIIGLVAISLLLLAAAIYSFVRIGACRERCQSNDTNGFMKFWTQMPKPFPQSLCRQQQVLTQESEVMDDSEIEYSTIAHLGCKRPCVQELSSSTAYALVRVSCSQSKERSSMASAQGELPTPSPTTRGLQTSLQLPARLSL
ncbi:uncharacterized protein [Pithys albifrons albifrons]|uniref:uncharacterized protein isoform X2 n=1 Tax=Pithys albifrons albifrons TaxID=3385563 RepID=UPI003A5CD317